MTRVWWISIPWWKEFVAGRICGSWDCCLEWSKMWRAIRPVIIKQVNWRVWMYSEDWMYRRLYFKKPIRDESRSWLVSSSVINSDPCEVDIVFTDACSCQSVCPSVCLFVCTKKLKKLGLLMEIGVTCSDMCHWSDYILVTHDLDISPWLLLHRVVQKKLHKV